MERIRITKSFYFEMAHALHGYDGKCAQIHGHSYKLYVTIIGTPNESPASPKLGMVMDFGDLKAIVTDRIVSNFDHAVVLYKRGGTVSSDETKLLQRVVYVDFQPTCENLISFIASELRPQLPSDVSLHSLRLVETASSYTEWFAEDNS